MIPLQLELTNFLSYRKTAVLPFDGIHLACISGANGAGKSTILDAMIWSLFGQSRSKSDDDVVNRVAALAGEEAEVKFTFDLEGSTYRVIRRKRPRKSLVLEFQIATGDDEWRSLSENKIRETQAAIENLLRMNHDTFINASFLLQGKADEFTTKTPNRRKEILADLLGVNVWDRYKAAATARRKETEGRLMLLEGQLGDIEQELAEEEARKATLAAAQAELDQVSERRALKEEILTQLRRAEAAIQQHKETVKNLANSLARAQRTLANLQKTQAQRQQERANYQAILAQAQQITANFTAWQEAEETLQTWQNKADAYNKLQHSKRPHELAVAQERSRLQQRQKELEAQAEQVATAAAERDGVAQTLQQGQARLAEIGASLADLATQEKAWHEARSELQRLQGERKLLAQEQNQLQTQARRLEKMAQEKTAVVQNKEEAQAALTELAAAIAAFSENHKRLAAARGEKDTLQAEQPRLRTQMDKIKERLDGLQAETGGACPLCGQELSEEHRHAVVAELKTDGRELGDRFRANKKQIEALEAEVATLEKKIKQGPRLERDQQAQQQRLAKAEARLAEIEEALAEWESEGAARLAELEEALADESALDAQKKQVAELATAVQEKEKLEKERHSQQRQVSTAEARLAEIDRITAVWEKEGPAALATVKQRLQTGGYAPQAQEALAELEQQIEALGYDEAAHQAAREARDALAEAPARHQELKQAEAAVKPLEDGLADLEEQISEQVKTVTDLTQQHEVADAQLKKMVAEGGDLKAVEDEVFQLREDENKAARSVGAAQQRLAVLDDLRQQQKQYKQEQAEVKQLIQRLKLMEKACGRDGVQALLIEQALPDIEDRANELLERLTGGDMHVTFETQRQLKSRKATVETLDIRIVDGAGERPYENFSGGEQFRVNFAIRLALSQILAKRAGARLQTLVIDEGFGSQDPNGRQRLVEAINTIQDDFARILVITHIDELRDAFPTRIEVEKELTGSKIAVA